MSFDVTRAIFNQVDVNRDGSIDQSEFSQWANDELGVSNLLSPSNLNQSSKENLVNAGSTVGINVSSTAGCNPPTYPTDSRGFFQDPMPQVVTQTAPGGPPTYTQNIKIRFLQPPPLPPPQPIIIQQVRPPRPPTQPPLRIREPAKPAVQPPPLILRECPPEPPPSIPGRVITETLPPYPPAPRSVITERFPSPPPRPRDIILVRWVPYGPQPPRRIVRMRAPSVPSPSPPRNILIQYEPIQVRVVRQFQRLNVSQADPEAYRQQYGASLLDTDRFLQQIRAIGVVEDISAPAFNASFQSSANSNIATGSDILAEVGALESSFDGVALSEQTANGARIDGRSDVLDTAFHNADTDRDGTLDQAEFESFLQRGLSN